MVHSDKSYSQHYSRAVFETQTESFSYIVNDRLALFCQCSVDSLFQLVNIIFNQDDVREKEIQKSSANIKVRNNKASHHGKIRVILGSAITFRSVAATKSDSHTQISPKMQRHENWAGREVTVQPIQSGINNLLYIFNLSSTSCRNQKQQCMRNATGKDGQYSIWP